MYRRRKPVVRDVCSLVYDCNATGLGHMFFSSRLVSSRLEQQLPFALSSHLPVMISERHSGQLDEWLVLNH